MLSFISIDFYSRFSECPFSGLLIVRVKSTGQRLTLLRTYKAS